MNDELEYAIGQERRWRAHRLTLDGGSYCENASPEYKAAANIERSYRLLADALLEHERNGFKVPK